MNEGIRTMLYPIKDIAKAKAFFSKLLGSEPTSDYPAYAGFNMGGQEIGLVASSLDLSLVGPLGYFHVSDIHKSVKDLVDTGGKVQQAARDVGGGTLVATVQDPDGNIIGRRQNA